MHNLSCVRLKRRKTQLVWTFVCAELWRGLVRVPHKLTARHVAASLGPQASVSRGKHPTRGLESRRCTENRTCCSRILRTSVIGGAVCQSHLTRQVRLFDWTALQQRANNRLRAQCPCLQDPGFYWFFFSFQTVCFRAARQQLRLWRRKSRMQNNVCRYLKWKHYASFQNLVSVLQNFFLLDFKLSKLFLFFQFQNTAWCSSHIFTASLLYSMTYQRHARIHDKIAFNPNFSRRNEALFQWVGRTTHVSTCVEARWTG